MKTYYSLIIICLGILIPLKTKAQTDTTILLNCRDAIVTCASTWNNPGVAAIKPIGNTMNGVLGGTITPGSTWNPPTIMPTSWTRDSLGEVFGTAIDNAGNVYLAGTALYSSFTWDLAKTTANLQTPISGMNRGYGNAGSGGIYKADGTNLNIINPLVHSVSSTSLTISGVGTNYNINNGYGIGNIAFSNTANKLYATNLEDGTILVINPTTGNIDQIYDPFVLDGGSNQVSGYNERLFGIAVQETSTANSPRVYFSRLVSRSISEVHSVEIDGSGLLIASTISLEISLNKTSTYNDITDIAFSDRGELLLAEKGDAHGSAVFKYIGDHMAWSILDQRIISGFGSYNANSAGGVDFGPKQIDSLDYACDSLIWAMSNAIAVNPPGFGTNSYYGAISQPLSGYSDESNYHLESYIVDLGLQKGAFGDIEFFDCNCGVEFNAACDQVSIEAFPVDSIIDSLAVCCYKVELFNAYHDEYFSGFEITSNTANIIHASTDNNNLGVQYNSISSSSFTYNTNHFMPFTTDEKTFVTVCFDGKESSLINVNFIGTLPQNDTVCTKTFETQDCSEDLPATCALITDQIIECKDGIYQMSFSVENLADFTMKGITIYSIDSNLYPFDNFLPIADLNPDSTGMYTIPMYFDGFNVDSAGKIIDETCFMFSACDVNINPLISGVYPDNCCLDSIEYCATIPDCGFGNGGCYGIDMTYHQQEGDDCCFDLSLSVSEVSSPIECIKFTGNAGAQFALFSGWNIQPGVTSNQVTLCSPGDYLSPGKYDEFANFCLTGFAQNPYEILIEYKDTNGHTICIDSMQIQSTCELVEPSCINFTNYSLECQGDSTVFTFDIHNNSDFDVKQFEIRNDDSNLTLNQTLFVPDSAILQDKTQGSFQLLIDNFSGNSVEDLCLYLTAHNEVYDSIEQTAATICCTDSLGSSICLPLPYCGPDTTQLACCTFDHLKIPNGITPNNDGINDLWEIEGLDSCDKLSIVIFNRWGNEIYSDDNYNNNWDGKMDNGNLVLQGTYYIKMTLASGQSIVQFIDVRY